MSGIFQGEVERNHTIYAEKTRIKMTMIMTIRGNHHRWKTKKL